MKKVYPQRTANEVTLVIRAAGVASFPVDVRTVAIEFSKAKYPDSPINVIKGASLPGFEGALSPAPDGKTGWGIFYNSDVSSPGRINFTLSHEFGHYLLHREAYPTGFQCNTEDMATWESEYGQRENEANTFAATLLMPFDDFRAHISEARRPDLDELSACAIRYDVSLIAVTLRWLQFTKRRSILVISRDGFILWARSSHAALKSGIYFRTRNKPPVEIPCKSLAANSASFIGNMGKAELDRDVWFNQACTEHTLVSEQYDFTLSLLHFADSDCGGEDHEDYIEDIAEHISRGTLE